MRVHRFLFALCLAAALPIGAAAQQAPARRPITHEDVWLAKRLSGLDVSPDGRWVLFAVSEPAYDAHRERPVGRAQRRQRRAAAAHGDPRG
jgi:hypothetical protein